MDRSNHILAGTGRANTPLGGFMKTQGPKMPPQMFLECRFTCRNTNDGFAVLPHHFLFKARVTPERRYFIK
jgi:hypothetical protein